MSSIRHTVHDHAWIYAAAATALVAGLLVVLMTTVFAGSDTVTTTQGAPSAVGAYRHFGRAYAPPCFAGHPTMSIELARSGCRA
jgi:uncharacterized membrane protein YdfJ with MMPL/SSD domain